MLFSWVTFFLAWSIEGFAQDAIANGDFENDTDEWHVQGNVTITSQVEVCDVPYACHAILLGSGTRSSIAQNISLSFGQPYTMTLKTSYLPSSSSITCDPPNDVWACIVGQDKVNLGDSLESPEWSDWDFSWVANRTYAAIIISFNGACGGEYLVDAVSVVPTELYRVDKATTLVADGPEDEDDGEDNDGSPGHSSKDEDASSRGDDSSGDNGPSGHDGPSGDNDTSKNDDPPDKEESHAANLSTNDPFADKATVVFPVETPSITPISPLPPQPNPSNTLDTTSDSRPNLAFLFGVISALFVMIFAFIFCMKRMKRILKKRKPDSLPRYSAFDGWIKT